MSTFAALVSYHGAPFNGFARQPGLPTVQGGIEHALSTVFRIPVETVCAGRTDTGVHALGQVVSFSIDDEHLAGRTEQSLTRSLNALVPEGIGIREIVRVPEGFSARFDAVAREYRYFIHSGSAKPLIMGDFCWHIRADLDLDVMRIGATYLIGEHDFKSFCLAASAKDKPTHRFVERIDIQPVRIMGDSYTCITVKGNAFLHSMVRTIVGTLVLVGRKKREPHWVSDVLLARDRSAAGENAPACGLIFWKVEYPHDLFAHENAL